MENGNFVLGNKKLEKLATEKTAFSNCRADLSDVSFEIGNQLLLIAYSIW